LPNTPSVRELQRKRLMPSVDTLPITLTFSTCEPPPMPPVASRRRRRPATLEPGMRIGVWRIERELGRGGMATVYAVVHSQFGKRAALKLAHRAVLGKQFTPETFLREARAANLIEHPGIVEVFATGTYDGRPYLAMELVSGRSLGDRLTEPMSRDEALTILLELCDVLAAAHAAGVIHRDLKLDNVVLLDTPGTDGRRTKLLDWGMARIAGEDDPLRGLIAGTLTYVAPEQVRGDDVTAAADIYALAVLAYRLLLGAPPFASPSDLELIHQHLYARPPQPRTRWSEIPRELEATLLAMLAKHPDERPALPEIAGVLARARAQLRPSTPRLRERMGKVPRPPQLFATRQQRVAGAALGLALTIASLIQLLSA
jgi:serine/threonine protein kinase